MAARAHLLSWFLLAQGCATLAPTQTADTLGRGRLQVVLQPGLSAPRTKDPEQPSAVPVFDASVRYGAFDRLDVGVQLGQSGLGVNAKVMVTPREWPVLLSLAPHLEGQLNFGDRLDVRGLWIHVGLPVLLGIRLGAHQVVIGPRVDLFANPQTTRWFAAGGSLGVLLRVSRSVAVMPELAAVVPLSAPAEPPLLDGFARLTAGPLVQVRLGFLLGAHDEPAR